MCLIKEQPLRGPFLPVVFWFEHGICRRSVLFRQVPRGENLMKGLRGILANCLSGRGCGEWSNLCIWREEKAWSALKKAHWVQLDKFICLSAPMCLFRSTSTGCFLPPNLKTSPLQHITSLLYHTHVHEF